jgi:Skp family chaperone for outer membrane proteins
MKRYLVIVAAALFLVACNDKAEEVSDEKEVSTEDKVEVKPETVSQVIKEAGDLKLGYFFLDSIMEKFTYFQKAQVEAQNTVADIEKRLMAKQSALEKWAYDLQMKGQQGLLTSKESQQAEIDMQRKGENLQKDKMKSQNEVQQIQFDLENDVMVKIRRFVKKYAEENGYDIIQQRTTMEAGYFGQSYNLSSVILEGLNKEESK